MESEPAAKKGKTAPEWAQEIEATEEQVEEGAGLAVPEEDHKLFKGMWN